jgi:hypothetical protein
LVCYTLSGFAKKLGFCSAQDKEFKQKLRRWTRQGDVTVYQGGFKGHSLAHPKKVKLHHALASYFDAPAVAVELEKINLADLAEELGLKLSSSLSCHDCSFCENKIGYGKRYVALTIFVKVKLCSTCLRQIYEANKKVRS